MQSINHHSRWYILSGIILICSFLSCSKSDDPEQGKLSVIIHDALGDMKQLSVIVSHITIHRAGSPEDVGWSTISSLIDVPFDVLNLRNGRKLELILSDAPKGKYDKLKIFFGASSVEMTDGWHYIQPYSSAGYTMTFDFEVVDGSTCQLSLDMNAGASVTQSGGSYNLTPSIQIRNVALCGWIAGSILDTSAAPVFAQISTVVGTDTVVTLNDILQGGSFELLDLPGGMYAVKIVSSDVNWCDTVVYPVTVIPGQVYAMGAIRLRPQ